ncbi:MAG: vitamin K epoxide reductase family protein [Verrucomicrobiae bacterium]|nr:vitamin K epoxide reductase family protein [Verrucomicrobiae bacterium]
MNSDPVPPTPAAWRPIAALVLGMLGFAAAVATLYATPIEGVTDLGCGVRVLDCSGVLGSHWGKIAGIPLGIFGGAYFGSWIVAIGSWWRSRDSALLSIATWIMSFGAIVSITLLSLLLFVIEGNCLFCLITHATNLGAAILLWPFRRWQLSSLKAIAIRGSLLLLMSLLFALGLFQLYQARVERAEAKARQETIW